MSDFSTREGLGSWPEAAPGLCLPQPAEPQREPPGFVSRQSRLVKRSDVCGDLCPSPLGQEPLSPTGAEPMGGPSLMLWFFFLPPHRP